MKNNQENTSNVASPQAHDTHVTPTPTDQPITASVPETNQQVMQTTSTGPEIQPANQVQGAPVTTPTPQPTTANSGGNLINKLKSFGVGPIVTVIAIAVVLVVAVVISAVSTTPKSVFKNSINKAYKGANVAIESYETYLDKYDLTKHAISFTGDLAIDTNIEDMEYDISKMTFTYDTGIDYKNEILNAGAKITNNKESVTINAQVIKNELFIKSSLFDEVLKLDSELTENLGVDIDFEALKEDMEEMQKEYDTDPETYEYLVKTIKDAFVKSINSEYMEKEKDEIEVLNKEIKVTKYSYIINEDAAQDLVEKVAEYLLNEEDFAKKLAAATGEEKSDVKSTLKEMKKSAKDIELDEEIAIVIYTRGMFNSYAGMGFEIDGEEYFSIYTDGKNAELTIDNNSSDSYSASKMVVTMEESGKGYKIVAKENKETLFEIDLKEYSEEKIDADITLYENDEKYMTMEVFFSIKEKKNTFSGEYKYKAADASGETKEYVALSGNYSLTLQDELTKMNTKNAIDYENIDKVKLNDNIEKLTDKDAVLGEIASDAVTSIEKEILDLNSIGMSEVDDAEKAIKLLTNQKATVLYVGDTYYLQYSETDSYNLLRNLKTLQTELDFYSYYLDNYLVTNAFEAVVKDVVYTCPVETKDPETTPTPPDIEVYPQDEQPTNSGEVTSPSTCAKTYPVIYLIKDGKVQKAFTGTVTYDDLKKALSEIGIE